MSNSIFDKPFDDGTKAKLEIFKQYFEEWLPVFTSGKKIYWDKVQVFDFFAGQGCDCTGYNGSPVIIMETAKQLKHFIETNKINLRIVLNEKDPKTYAQLKGNITSLPYVNDFNPELYNKAFDVLFKENYDKMPDAANFLFLDQNGIREITQEIFSKITELKTTDFLFFISSSYFKRFAKTSEFRKYFPNIDEDIDKTNYYHIHRKVLQHYKSLIPKNKEYFLAPFSIKKGTNIYGLIFGTNHTLGIEKFLSVAWKLDKHRGEANYDIDGDKIDELAPKLFSEQDIPNKKQVFEKKLIESILNGTLKTNREVYLYTLMEGFMLNDANPILKKLKAERKIDYSFKLLNNKLHKEKDIQNITVK
jgi:three-Cys-motif partner protein